MDCWAILSQKWVEYAFYTTTGVGTTLSSDSYSLPNILVVASNQSQQEQEPQQQYQFGTHAI